MLAGALLMLGVLAAAAVLACELPWLLSLPIAAIAVLYGAWLARRELRQATLEVVIPSGTATIDGLPVSDLQVHWRGSFAFLHWRDAAGRRQRRLGWPDNLGPAARRELRLAMATRVPAHTPRSVAP
jgi:toxin CptA